MGALTTKKSQKNPSNNKTIGTKKNQIKSKGVSSFSTKLTTTDLHLKHFPIESFSFPFFEENWNEIK